MGDLLDELNAQQTVEEPVVQEPSAQPQQPPQPGPQIEQTAVQQPQPVAQQAPVPVEEKGDLIDELVRQNPGVLPEFEEVVQANQQFQERVDPGQIGHKDDRSMIEALADDIERIGGATAGSIAGSARGATMGARFGKPGLVIGGLVGGVAGAATGGGIGQGAKEARLLVLDRPDKAKTTDEAFGRILNAAGEEAAAEALIGTLFIGGRGLFNMINPMKKAITDFKQVNDTLLAQGSNLSISQATDSAFAKGLEQVTAGTLRGGQVISDKVLEQSRAVGKLQDALLEGISPNHLTNEGLGRLVSDVITKGRLLHRSVGGAMYQRVDDLVGSALVDISPARRLAKTTVEKLKQSGGFGSSSELITKLNKFSSEAPSQRVLGDGTVFTPDDTLFFSQVQEIRSNVLEEIRRLEKTEGKGKSVRELKGLVKSLNKSMDTAANQANPDALKLYKAANKFWKQGEKNLNNKFIRKLVKGEGSANRFSTIGQQLAQSPENVKLIRDAVARATKERSRRSFKDVWVDVQRGYLENLLNVTESGRISEKGMKKLIQIAKNEAPRKELETFNSMFTQAQRQAIKKFARVVEVTDPINPSNIAVLRQAGNLIEGGSFSGKATGFVPAAVMPKIMAHLLTSPHSTRTLALMARDNTVESSKLLKILGNTTDQLVKRGAAQTIGPELREGAQDKLQDLQQLVP